MTTKPTPGPWRVEPDGSIVGPDGCDVIASHADYLGGHYLAATEEDRRLIAAAPDLLAACEAVAATTWSKNTATIIGEQVRAAIAKAKGET
jgi:hypothetical protein